MVKVFTTNSDGKIEFTKDELEKLLDEEWNDGRNSNFIWTSTTPPHPTYPVYTTASSDTKITIE